MKRFRLSLLLTVLTSMAGTTSFAHDFEMDGIYYKYNNGSSGTSVCVTFKGQYAGGGYYSYDGEVVIPASVTYNGSTYSVTSIGGSAFFGCSGLTSVTIPNTVTSIEMDAFSGSGLTSITIPNSVTSIGGCAFDSCSGLTSIVIPNSVTTIVWSTFLNCSGLTSVTIPNSVTSIGYQAFSGCSSLNSVTIPNNVTSIGGNAFSGCSSLTSVKSMIEVPFIFGSNAFDNIKSDCVLQVPYGTRDTYLSMGWTTDVFKGGIVEMDPKPVHITMATNSGVAREMIGFSSKYGLDFTNVPDLRAYTIVGYEEGLEDVMGYRVYEVPPYTGIVIKTDNPGIEVDVPISTKRWNYANFLKPVVEQQTVNPTETIDGEDYTNFMVGKLDNGEMGFARVKNATTTQNKCYLPVLSSFYETAPARQDGGFGIVFIDNEETDINAMLYHGQPTNGNYYDLQGRKVKPVSKGLYIHNGKKVFVK